MKPVATPTDPSGPQRVSALAGRRRYRWPQLQRAEAAGQLLAEHLARLPGVQAVRFYPLSGSLVVHYDPQHCDVHALEAALTAWRPPAALLQTRQLLPHQTHDVWGWLLLARILFQHLVLERDRPFRGQRLTHLSTALLLTSTLPLLRGALGRREPGPHALEILLSLANLLSQEHRRTTALLWLFHLPEVATLARWLWQQIARPAAATAEEVP